VTGDSLTNVLNIRSKLHKAAVGQTGIVMGMRMFPHSGVNMF